MLDKCRSDWTLILAALQAEVSSKVKIVGDFESTEFQVGQSAAAVLD